MGASYGLQARQRRPPSAKLTIMIIVPAWRKGESWHARRSRDLAQTGSCSSTPAYARKHHPIPLSRPSHARLAPPIHTGCPCSAVFAGTAERGTLPAENRDSVARWSEGMAVETLISARIEWIRAGDSGVWFRIEPSWKRGTGGPDRDARGSKGKNCGEMSFGFMVLEHGWIAGVKDATASRHVDVYTFRYLGKQGKFLFHRRQPQRVAADLGCFRGGEGLGNGVRRHRVARRHPLPHVILHYPSQLVGDGWIGLHESWQPVRRGCLRRKWQTYPWLHTATFLLRLSRPRDSSCTVSKPP